jgi:hypothetical protein
MDTLYIPLREQKLRRRSCRSKHSFAMWVFGKPINPLLRNLQWLQRR